LKPEKSPRSWAWDVGVPVLLVLLALLPRVVAFGAMGNPDEVGWLIKSVAFYDGLARGEWAATFQAPHPGVVPMWGFGALLSIRYGLGQLQAWQAADALPMAELARTALFWPVLVSVLSVLAVYGLVRRLAGREAALYASVLVALEPYFLAFTHNIHLDATQSSIMLVAALLWINYLHRPRWPYLVGSGIVSGLAVLTRLQSIYLLPFALLAAGFYFLADNLAGKGAHLRAGWGRWIGRVGLAWLGWLGLLAVTTFVLWPALWVMPGTILQQWADTTVRQVGTPHRWPVFFFGQVITTDPGMLYYALILLFRLRPLTLALAIVNPVLLGLSWRRLSPQQRAAWGLGICYVVFYFVQMSLGAHKLERYLLPLFPALSILAGVSLAVVVRWLSGLVGRWWGRAVPVALRAAFVSVVVIALAIPWLRLSPYFDTYFNPVAGGGPRAAELFTVGSGGGLDLAAAHLNAKPGAEDLWALSFYPEVFRYYFKGHTQSPSWGIWAGLPVAGQYVVVTLGQIQRDIYAPTLDFFLPRQPEYTVHLNDLDYAWVYQVPRQELSTPPLIQQSMDANFEHRVHLIGYDADLAGEQLQVALYWHLIVSMKDPLRVRLRMVDDAGRVVVEQIDPPWSGDVVVLSWPDGLAVRDVHTLSLPPDLPPGDYSVVVSLGEVSEDGQERLLVLEDDGGTDVILGPLPIETP
jgi:hypothetical protein